MRWLKARGFEARAEPFAFPKVTVNAAYALAGGARVEGVPLFDAAATGPGGRSGTIPVFEHQLPEDLEARRDRLAGAILVTGDPQGHVLLRNAERMDRPLGFPVLQIARRDAGPLQEPKTPLRLVNDAVLAQAYATNVVADLPCSGAEGLVVMLTPKSGWFQCAAERGGGIAIAMALGAAATALSGRRRSLRLLFTSGHELGHRGLLAYLAADPARRTQPGFWLQLGASIGARDASQMRMFTRDPELRSWFPRALEREGIPDVALAAADLRPHGESREVFDRPFLSVAGRHPYFHSPLDTPDRTVDADSVARHARAFAALLDRLLR